MSNRIHVHVPFSRLFEFIDTARHRGLNLEIYFSAETLDRTGPADLRGARAALDWGPRLVFHAPFIDLSPGAVDPEIRKVTMRRFRQLLEAAEALRPHTLVFHSGYEKWKYALATDIWLRQSLQTWEQILKETESLDVRVVIENIFEDRPDNLRELMNALDHPRFALCFDTGHFNLFSAISLTEWMDDIGDRVAHLHVHDNDGSADRHAPPGTGSFPFSELMDWLKDRGQTLTLEAHSREDAVTGLRFLNDMLTRRGLS